jgi:hypothetical protein
MNTSGVMQKLMGLIGRQQFDVFCLSVVPLLNYWMLGQPMNEKKNRAGLVKTILYSPVHNHNDISVNVAWLHNLAMVANDLPHPTANPSKACGRLCMLLQAM